MPGASPTRRAHCYDGGQWLPILAVSGQQWRAELNVSQHVQRLSALWGGGPARAAIAAAAATALLGMRKAGGQPIGGGNRVPVEAVVTSSAPLLTDQAWKLHAHVG